MKKKILLFILMLTLFIAPVFADEVYETEYAKAGDTVNYDNTNDGSIFLAGNVVDYNGKSDGIIFSAANSNNISGEGEYALVAGNTLDFKTTIKKDAFLAGNILKVNAKIKRDVYIAGSDITLTGEVGRKAIIAGENVTLDNVTIKGNVEIYSNRLTIKDNVIIDGKLTYDSDNALISNTAKIGSTNKIEGNHTNIVKITFLTTLKSRAISFASMLLVFACLALLIPRSIKNVGREELSFLQIITYIGYALVFLILVPMASLMLMLLVVGIPLAIMLIAFYIAAIYLSYGYMGYYIGKQIMKKIGNTENVLLEGLIGIGILYAVSLIPHIGGPITLLAYLCGLGIFIFNLKK